ncbi:MAG: hypothetical protein R3E31_02655 [Chloroflexota bacterium]
MTRYKNAENGRSIQQASLFTNSREQAKANDAGPHLNGKHWKPDGDNQVGPQQLHAARAATSAGLVALIIIV